ncbi:MAG: GNAT family N-acetyltransferase [Acidimicrobiales bacterium]
MIVAARPAEPADLEALTSLVDQAAAVASDLRGGTLFLARELSGLEILVDLPTAGDESRLVAVGTLDGVVLGVAVACVEVVGGSPLGRLQALWVDPEARSVGVGQELLGLVARWAADRGAERIDAYALPGDRATKNLFESAGFSARLIVMHRAPPDRV